VDLPLARATNNFPTTTILLQDTGTSNFSGIADYSGDTLFIFAISASGTYANQANTSATVPFTWTTNDNIFISGTYETSVA
jgi:hypothetical protein